MTDQTTAEATPDEQVAAPRARRSRRATAPAGAATQVAPAATQDAAAPTDEGHGSTDPAPVDAAAAPARPKRVRASRAKAAPAADERSAASGDAAEPSPAAAGQGDADPDVAPARATRSRRSRAAAVAPEPAPVAEVRSGAGLDVLAELGAPRPAAARVAPELTRSELVFQAPDLSGPTRRRRAQAPAGPPRDAEVPQAATDEHAPGAPADEAGLTEDELTEDELAAAAQAEADEEADGDDQGPADDGDDQGDGEEGGAARRRRRRGGRGRRSRSGGGDREADAAQVPTGEDESGDADEPDENDADDVDDAEQAEGSTSSRRRRRRRRGAARSEAVADEPAPRSRTRATRATSGTDEVTALKGSTRLEAKRQRRREGRDAGRRRAVITEAEFLARREAVARAMVVRESNGRVQIAVLEDGVLVEHFVSRSQGGQGGASMAGNVYLGRVQNVLPSMEAAFVDVGKGRNAVLYAGEVNWDAAGLEGQPRRIEQALKSGDPVLVQVTKDPIGHKGARLTSQITLAGRYLVYVPAGGMTGISRKLPENERARLKKLLKEIVPDAAGVIVRTAAEGASEEELRRDVQRLQDQWAAIEKKATSASAPALLQGEPDLAIRVVRDIFNDDFTSLVVQGDGAWDMIHEYVDAMAPDLAERVSRYTGTGDVFAEHRIDEQLAKGMDRKVWLPSGGSLVIDRTEAMTVVDVNTGKFTGSGGTLEETVTRNNLEAAEEIVRQLRLRDIGGIIVIDFIDMVLESNRDLVLRRLVECLGRDRTKHQVAEVTSLGLVQMTRKRVGQGLVEAFSETCAHCNGRGFLVRSEPVEPRSGDQPVADQPEEGAPSGEPKRARRRKAAAPAATVAVPVLPEAREAVKATLATIAAAAAHAHEHEHDHDHDHDELAAGADQPVEDQPVEDQPVEDQPVEDQHVEDQPVEDQPVEDEPVTDEQISDQQV